jgi:hypothetical protein
MSHEMRYVVRTSNSSTSSSIKRIRFTETKNLEFRTEIFNLFNRANFDIPGSRLNLALPTVSLANGVYTVSTSNALQPGQRTLRVPAGDLRFVCDKQLFAMLGWARAGRFSLLCASTSELTSRRLLPHKRRSDL